MIVTALAAAAALEVLLAFEGPTEKGPPSGWGGGPSETLFSDSKVVHGGSASGRIERTGSSPSGFSALTTSIPMDFAGATIELRGFVRTEGVEGWCGLWAREDGPSGPVAFDNMQTRGVTGTTDWTEYKILLPIEAEGITLFFGALLSGKGKIWVDDLQLLVDGKPLASAPKRTRTKTPLDTDREFDSGSKVTVGSLTPSQVSNLSLLGRVWGFLKYHHPKVVKGDVHWDYELFRVMPRVLVATDASSGAKTILDWARGLGDVAACDPCASLPEGLALRPDLGWIHDRVTLGTSLSEYLEDVYRKRRKEDAQAYIKLVPGVGNPQFLLESGTPERVLPDAGQRILALYRWWNVVQYWSPYRDVIGEDWNAVLPEFLPRIVAAKDLDGYQREMLALISRLGDGHANLWAALDARPPLGACRVPVRVRYVEGSPVVIETYAETGLRVGDVIRTVNGVVVDRLVEPWKPYYSASNDSFRMNAIMGELTDGACGTVALKVERSGGRAEVKAERQPAEDLKARIRFENDRPGDVFQRLSPEVAYLKLSGVKTDEIPEYLRRAEGTKGWVIDIRNYPSAFMVFALGGHFVSKTTPFVRFTIGDLSNPGAFRMTDPPLSIGPLTPHYAGKVVVLVDESTISSAEYTAMAFRAAGAVIVGSTTAGADGNVSALPLPGGLRTMISGIGVFYPDKKPTQRVGIVPDHVVQPTIAGIRAGRDEVLEAAVRLITGESP